MKADLKIKVCGMREPSNIRELIRWEPDFMGFIFYPGSKRFVRDPDPEVFRSIPSRTRKVGVFVNESAGAIRRLVADLGLDLVQLHGDESPGYCESLTGSGIPVIKAFRITEKSGTRQIHNYKDSCDYFLFDAGGRGFGGTGKKFDWNVLGGYGLTVPFFLSGGIGPGDLPEILSLGLPAMAGIDINSRFETEPGVKDISIVSEFIQTIRRR